MTTRSIAAAKAARDALASSHHFIDFSNISGEWAYYQNWRNTVTNKPQNVTYMEYYLQQRVNQLNTYLGALVTQITNSASDQPLVAALGIYRDEASRLQKVYNYGVATTDDDPQDERAFRRAIQPMSNAAVDRNIVARLSDLPSNVTLASTTTAPPAPPETFLDKLFGPKVKFTNGYHQYKVVKAKGFQMKRFQRLHKSIPPAIATPNMNATLANLNATGPYCVKTELANDPRPAQLDLRSFGYTRHPDDYSDRHYRELYGTLYRRVVDWAEKWFGDVDIPDKNDGYDGSPWEEHLGDQFIEYSRLVAHEDRHCGGWDALLKKHQYRKWLIVGIVGQIIQKKIFSELLFGVDREWRKELEDEDLRLLNIEGYRRKASRSEKVKMALGGSLAPRDFWGAVDDVAWGSAVIFEPLINLLDLWRPVSDEHQTDLNLLYQELHAIIQVAGFVQVCTALSPSIFHHLSATPGARMDWQIEQQAEVGLYRHSKETNETLEAQWEEVMDHLNAGRRVPDATVDRFNAMYPIPLQPTLKHAKLKSAETDADYRTAVAVARHHRLRGARVQIAAFPMLKRYTPENRGVRPRAFDPNPSPTGNQADGAGGNTTEGGKKTGTDTNDKTTKANTNTNRRTNLHHHRHGQGRRLGDHTDDDTADPNNTNLTRQRRPGDNVLDWADLEGQRVTDVFRCCVVYYQGLMYPAQPSDDGIPLDTYLTLSRGYERLPSRLAYTTIFIVGALALLALEVLHWAVIAAFWGREEAYQWLVGSWAVTLLQFFWPVRELYGLLYWAVREGGCWALCALHVRCSCTAVAVPVAVPAPAPVPFL